MCLLRCIPLFSILERFLTQLSLYMFKKVILIKISVQVYFSVHFLPILFGNQVFIFLCFLCYILCDFLLSLKQFSYHKNLILGQNKKHFQKKKDSSAQSNMKKKTCMRDAFCMTKIFDAFILYFFSPSCVLILPFLIHLYNYGCD